MKFKIRRLATVVLTTAIAGQAVFGQSTGARTTGQAAQRTDSERIALLETLLENIRQELKIPAYSAAIVKDQKAVWARGFGYADVENKIPATEHTPYHLASLTKTFASTILMQLVQEGKIKLDDPVFKVRHHPAERWCHHSAPFVLAHL